MTAYLGLGSNRGDRVSWIEAGLRALRERRVRVNRCSSLWLSEPVGDVSMPWFINCVIEVTTPPDPERLLEAALGAEQACGRRRQPGVLSARTFDADVLLYDSRVMDMADLQIPHPRMHERRFVLNPLAELAPDLVHPTAGATIATLRDGLRCRERAWLLAPGEF